MNDIKKFLRTYGGAIIGALIAILILLNYLGFDKSFSFKSIIFYIIIIISSVLGSITGINRKKAK